jgi:hypothetical protein
VRRQELRFVRPRRACSSTPLVLSLNLAMGSLTWYVAAMASALVPLYASRSRRGREGRRQPASQVASSSCSGLQMMKVACELLEFADVVIEQDVGEFVADVAVSASRVVARVVRGDGPPSGHVEGGRGECAGLEPLEFFEAGTVDEIVRRDDFDVQVPGERPDVEQVVRAQPHLSPGSFGEPVCF